MVRRYLIFRISMVVALAGVVAGMPVPALGGLGWPEIEIRMLPDSSFAVIEEDGRGRKFRRCPYRDGNGHLDVDQLVFGLGTLDRIEWIKQQNRKIAEKGLRKHYQKYLEGIEDFSIPVLNINEAALQALVRLPGIGPVLAVKIAEYRRHRARFLTREDIMNVDGISRGTFNAIRHYIEVD